MRYSLRKSETPTPSFSIMSVLPPEVHAALASLLQGLSSPDNHIRTQAEEQLNNEWVAARPDVLLMGLVEQMQSAPEPTVWHLPPSCFNDVTPRLTRLLYSDSLVRSSPLSKDVNKGEKIASDGRIKRAILVIAAAPKGGHKTETP